METKALSHILFSPTVMGKLTTVDGIFKLDPTYVPISIPKSPGQIPSSSLKKKFPSLDKLYLAENRGVALHFFAAHELQAIDMMCCILLILPHNNPELVTFKNSILVALRDEQKHLNLYVKRMSELGVTFGDLEIGDFFWKQMSKMTTPETFIAVMSLTLESANLDFSFFYKNYFMEIGDEATSLILEQVYEDELTHVKLGANWLSRNHPDRRLWDYYQEILPYPMTPARAKGNYFNEASRIKAGLDTYFVDNLKNYQDNFKITSRKTWR